MNTHTHTHTSTMGVYLNIYIVCTDPNDVYPSSLSGSLFPYLKIDKCMSTFDHDSK